MLQTMVDYNVMFYVMGVVAGIGLLSKLITQITLKRLMKAASDMNKSTHSLMKLMRAKFEHASMVADRVQNVNAFVEKYVYEYKAMGLRLHTWQQMQIQSSWMCAVIGILGAGLFYIRDGMDEPVFYYAGVGAVSAIILFLIHIASDEKYMLDHAKVYMVDYLENVCAHRYEKMYQRSRDGEAGENQDGEGFGEEADMSGFMEAEKLADKEENKDFQKVKKVLAAVRNEEEDKLADVKANLKVVESDVERDLKEDDNPGREAMIREILEEFLA